MLNLANIVTYLLEGVAVTIAIYLIALNAKTQLQVKELITLALTVGVTFMILDLFAPAVSQGARQGAGFGLGFKQVGGGTAFPNSYYGNSGTENFSGCGPNGCAVRSPVVEGMDDPVAIQYYQRYNPPYHVNNLPPALNTLKMNLGAPRILDYDGVRTPADEQPPESYSVQDMAAHQAVSKGQGVIVGSEPNQGYAELFDSDGKKKKNADVVTGDENNVPSARASPSAILKKLKANPFDTTVRSVTEVDLPGANYDKDNIPEAIGDITPDPILYSPLKPTYGYRYQLPRGWDDLEQENLYKAFNEFRNQVPNSMDCQSGPYGKDGQYNANFHYQKKNVA